MRTLASNDIIDMIDIFCWCWSLCWGQRWQKLSDKIFGNILFGHNLKLACWACYTWSYSEAVFVWQKHSTFKSVVSLAMFDREILMWKLLSWAQYEKPMCSDCIMYYYIHASKYWCICVLNARLHNAYMCAPVFNNVHAFAWLHPLNPENVKH